MEGSELVGVGRDVQRFLVVANTWEYNNCLLYFADRVSPVELRKLTGPATIYLVAKHLCTTHDPYARTRRNGRINVFLISPTSASIDTKIPPLHFMKR